LVDGAVRFLGFLVQGQGGQEIGRHLNGDRIAGAQLRLGTSTVMVSETSPALRLSRCCAAPPRCR
jgi:hypothetical protein